MYCRKCGVKIEDDSVFCYKCGERVVLVDDAPVMENSAEIKKEAASIPSAPVNTVTEPIHTAPVNAAAEPVQTVYVNIVDSIMSKPVSKTEPTVDVSDSVPCENGTSPVSNYINMDPSAAQARWSAPEIDKPMKWFDFLIYFSLWASAVIGILNSLMLFLDITTLQSIYYYMPDGMRLFFAAYMLLMGAFSVYIRYQLAGFKAIGPKLLIASYIVGELFTYVSYMVVAEYTRIDMSALWGTIAGGFASTAFMVVCNYIYFNKRKHLFVY